MSDFSSLFAGEKISKKDLIQLKSEVRAELLRRIYNENISKYGGALYDYTNSQNDATTSDEKVIIDYFNKILTPMQAINPTKLGFNNKYNSDTKETSSFVKDEPIPNLKELVSFLQTCQQEVNQNKLDISKSNCLSLCTGMCVTLCATGCSGTCVGRCSGSCSGRTCQTSCDAGDGQTPVDPPPPPSGGGGTGCSSCASGGCSGGCNTRCSDGDGCRGTCSGYQCKDGCFGSCSGRTCQSSCNASNCKGTCWVICNTGTKGSSK